MSKIIVPKTDQMSLRTRKPAFCLYRCENESRERCAVSAQLISAFVFATQIVESLFFLNPKFQASYLVFFRDCTGQFVSDMVGNPEDQFSRITAHIWAMVAMLY